MASFVLDFFSHRLLGKLTQVLRTMSVANFYIIDLLFDYYMKRRKKELTTKRKVLLLGAALATVCAVVAMNLFLKGTESISTLWFPVISYIATGLVLLVELGTVLTQRDVTRFHLLGAKIMIVGGMLILFGIPGAVLGFALVPILFLPGMLALFSGPVLLAGSMLVVLSDAAARIVNAKRR